MKNRKNELVDPIQLVDQAELAASLEPLGLREINERMEVAPLLADQGSDGMMTQDWVCCVCKINPDGLGDELPSIMDALTMEDEYGDFWYHPGRG